MYVYFVSNDSNHRDVYSNNVIRGRLKTYDIGDSIKVIILAAGIGSRLGHNIPKAMVELDGGLTILDMQLEFLKEKLELDDIIVVVGYKDGLIRERYPDLYYVHNSRYRDTNTSKSLLDGLKTVGKGSDVLWLNGDVVFEPRILELVREKLNDNLVCVNNSEISEEEVKYTLDREGFIQEISKEVQDARGEAVGINFIKKEHLSVLISCLEECQDQDYFEKGVEMALGRGVKFLPLDIGDNFCVEVDFWEDLKLARKFVKESKVV